MGDVIRPKFPQPEGEARPDHERPDYFALFARQAAAYEPSVEEKQAEVARALAEVRKGRLDRSKPSIRPEDRQAIIDGSLEPTSALDWVQRMYRYKQARRKPPKDYLVLLGQTGLGKTVAASWLLAEAGGYYVTADELRRKFTAPTWKDRDWFDGFAAGRCVVVDDVGTEMDAQGADLALFELVNRRQSMPQAFTVITGNLLEHEFRARYDARTVRRIEHAGAIVVVTGRDLRRGGP